MATIDDDDALTVLTVLLIELVGETWIIEGRPTAAGTPLAPFALSLLISRNNFQHFGGTTPIKRHACSHFSLLMKCFVKMSAAMQLVWQSSS
jgi:hypothetical protein